MSKQRYIVYLSTGEKQELDSEELQEYLIRKARSEHESKTIFLITSVDKKPSYYWDGKTWKESK